MSAQWSFYKFKANADKCYSELCSIGDEYTPQDVLDFAKNPKTELHKCFEWDDTKAAEQYRITQARLVCRSLVVVVERKHREPEKYRIIEHDREERVYRPVVFTVREEDQYDRLLSQAKRELAQFKARYKRITELEGVIEEIEKLIG